MRESPSDESLGYCRMPLRGKKTMTSGDVGSTRAGIAKQVQGHGPPDEARRYGKRRNVPDP